MSTYAYIVQARTAQDLGALVRHTRGTQGLTQAQLAERVGVTRAWVNEIERGKPTAEVGLVLRTLAALGLVADVINSGPVHGDVDLDELLR
jgi:HTH-type transcriptional regulator / antitoxin HipB